ncbi:MAG: hypothetical protein ABH825_03820 [Candidatus Omnitrophota bacterium]
MKKDYLLGILFFGSLWGLSEAALGGFLYGNHIRGASISLTVIAFMIMTFAKVYMPQKGSLIFVSATAMLYKFLNTPFFACHLLAVFLLGVAYEIAISVFKIKNRSLLGFLATYMGYALFAVIITYVVRYHYWAGAGSSKLIDYVGIKGTLASLGNAICVPLSFMAASTLNERAINPFTFRSRFATAGVSLITLVIWIGGAAKWF